MALDPYLYIDPLTDDFKDARHSAIYLSFIAECVDKLLESPPTTLSPAEIDASIDALGQLINHNAKTYKLACLQIPELEVDQSFTTLAEDRMTRLLTHTKHRRPATPAQPARTTTSHATALTPYFRKLRRHFLADSHYVRNVPMSQANRTACFAMMTRKFRDDTQGNLETASVGELAAIRMMQSVLDDMAGARALDLEHVVKWMEVTFPGVEVMMADEEAGGAAAGG